MHAFLTSQWPLYVLSITSDEQYHFTLGGRWRGWHARIITIRSSQCHISGIKAIVCLLATSLQTGAIVLEFDIVVGASDQVGFTHRDGHSMGSLSYSWISPHLSCQNHADTAHRHRLSKSLLKWPHCNLLFQWNTKQASNRSNLSEIKWSCTFHVTFWSEKKKQWIGCVLKLSPDRTTS